MNADAGREFLDTNVLVYAHDTSAGQKRAQAIWLLERLTLERAAALSVQVLQEFFVTVTGGMLRNRLQASEAAAIIADLSILPTHAPTGADVLAAIELHGRHQVSFWDAMVLRSAARLRCSVVWSEDLSSAHVDDGVEVRNPFR